MTTKYTVEQLQALLIEHDGGVLKHGSHKRGKGREFCGMEFVAKLAGEPWTADPQCSHPALSAYVRQLNDSTWPSDQERTRVLLPLIARVFGTRELPISVARIAEATIREIVPLAMESAALVATTPEHAKALRDAGERCKLEGSRDAADATGATGAAGAAGAYAGAYAAAAAAAAYAAYAAERIRIYEISVALVIVEIDRAEKEYAGG